MHIISKQQLQDRMEAIAEETMIEVCDTIKMTEKGATLYEKFCKIREQNALENYEEDCKIRDIFLKVAKEQGEEAEKEKNGLHTLDKEPLTDKEIKKL